MLIVLNVGDEPAEDGEDSQPVDVVAAGELCSGWGVVRGHGVLL